MFGLLSHDHPFDLLIIVLFLTFNFNAGASAVGIFPLTCTSVNISWTDINDATRYQVTWRLSNRNNVRPRQIFIRQTSVTLTELSGSSRYDFEVRAADRQDDEEILEGLFRTMRCTGSLDNNNNNDNEPFDQVNPTEPFDQVNPTEPVDQVNPTEPVDQVNPTEPVDQVNPTEPFDQVNPTEPIEPVGQVNFTEPNDQMNLIEPIDFYVNLTAQIVSSQMLMISWSYPSLLAETAFEVTYSLVSAYNTSAGIKSFAEYDKFSTTQTSFQFALVSSVTNYIFTVTPYSATHAGDSARVLVDDFSKVDLIEDPVIFFNLRLGSRTVNSLSSSDINKINSDLTRHIQSSINDACQCNLPFYTLRGSIDSCDRSQSNCAIYTGRLLGSDTASATEVFEMVEEWLATQNGSLLNGTLSIDPDCPLRLPSPSDTACSTWKKFSSPRDNADDDDTSELTLAQLLVITIASGVITVIICFIVIVSALCVCISHKPKKDDPLTSSTYAQPLVKPDDQRHYSIVVQKNQSYNHSHGKPQWNHSSELQNTYTNEDSIGLCSDPQQMTQSTFTTMQPEKPRNASETASTDYEDIYLSGEYCNVDDIIPDPLSVSYLSITQTQ